VAQMRHEMGHVHELWHSCVHFPFSSQRRVKDVCNIVVFMKVAILDRTLYCCFKLWLGKITREHDLTFDIESVDIEFEKCKLD